MKAYRLDNGKYKIKIALKGIQKQRTFYGTRMEAEDEGKRWRNELLRIRDGLRAPVFTVTDAMDYFLDNHAAKKKTKSYKDTKSHLERFKQKFGMLDARRLTHEMMESYFADLPNLWYKKKPEKKVNLSAASIHKYIILVRQAFEFVIKNKKLTENPLKYVSLPKIHNTRDRILNEDEWRRLYSELREHLKPLALFAYQVPCRISELLSLKRDKVDTSLGIVYLDDGKTKNNMGRVMPIPENLKDHFMSIPEESEYAFYRTVVDKKTKKKSYVQMKDIKTSFNKSKKRAGLDYLHFHDLRHCAVSSMASNGIRQEVIMKVAGMKTPSIFHRYRTINMKEIMDSVSFYKGLSLDKPKSSETSILLEKQEERSCSA